MIKVIVLDSGVFTQHPVFADRKITVYKPTNFEWKIADNNKLNIPDNPHGTAVCGIISKEVKDDVDIICFDIYNRNSQLMIQNMLTAMQYIFENIDCDIINISMGVRVSKPELECICQKIVQKGITIVSSFDNVGAISYPAAYPFVIGVDTSVRCTHINDFVYVENSPINIRAKGSSQRVPWINPMYIINQGSSFASPHVTAYIANLLSEGFTNTEALLKIKENAKFVYDNSDMFNHDDELQIKNVAIFPYNKEMHSIINFRKHLSFNITQICDTKYSGHIGKYIFGLYDKTEAFKIQNISSLKWDIIDTMIIGHTSEAEGVSGKSLKDDILQKCLDNGKNVYMFDNEGYSYYKPRFEEKGLFLYSPAAQKFQIKNHFGKLYVLNTPVLGILGTTKKQGKFTLQLQLRYELKKLGYNVGQLGTEPTSKLYQMDEVYPFGYNGIGDQEMPTCIERTNYLMHKIDSKNPDIILVGSQSGIIPLSYYNIGQIPLHQIAFLLGTKPDAIILCVNIDDPETQIARTINVIEGLVNCKVIALAIYPFVYPRSKGVVDSHKIKVDEADILKKKHSLKYNFNIPVGTVGEMSDSNIFIQSCLDFFGSNS